MTRHFLLFALFTCAAGAAEDAVALYHQKRYAEAQTAFEHRLQANPSDVAAHFYLGRLALARQELGEAIPHFQEAVEGDPENPEYLFQYGSSCVLHAGQLGTTFRALGLARRGCAAMEKAVEIAPDNLSYREGLIEFYAQAPGIAGGGMKKAYAAAEAMRAYDARRAVLMIARLKVRDDAPGEAITLLDAFLQTAPADYQALYLLGRTAAESGVNLDRGIAALESCLAMPPPPNSIGHDGVYFQLGQAHARKGDVAAARSAFEAALERQPAHQPAREALQRLGRP